MENGVAGTGAGAGAGARSQRSQEPGVRSQEPRAGTGTGMNNSLCFRRIGGIFPPDCEDSKANIWSNLRRGGRRQEDICHACLNRGSRGRSKKRRKLQSR